MLKRLIVSWIEGLLELEVDKFKDVPAVLDVLLPISVVVTFARENPAYEFQDLLNSLLVQGHPNAAIPSRQEESQFGEEIDFVDYLESCEGVLYAGEHGVELVDV